MIRIRLLLAALTLGACQTVAQQRLTTINQVSTQAGAAFKTCAATVRADPQFQGILGRVPESRPSLSQLADDSTMSPTERPLYIAVEEQMAVCRKARVDAAYQVSPALGTVLGESNTEADRLRLDLIRQKITWGQYYAAIVALDDRTRARVAAVNKEMMQELNAEHREELARRAAAAEAFSAAMQQQQLINSLNRPVSTTCNRFGNTVNCSTY